MHLYKGSNQFPKYSIPGGISWFGSMPVAENYCHARGQQREGILHNYRLKRKIGLLDMVDLESRVKLALWLKKNADKQLSIELLKALGSKKYYPKLLIGKKKLKEKDFSSLNDKEQNMAKIESNINNKLFEDIRFAFPVANSPIVTPLIKRFSQIDKDLKCREPEIRLLEGLHYRYNKEISRNSQYLRDYNLANVVCILSRIYKLGIDGWIQPPLRTFHGEVMLCNAEEDLEKKNVKSIFSCLPFKP
jgi:hypothetical protein